MSESAGLFNRQWLRWLNRRIPKSMSTVLDQRRIFILPSRQGVLFLAIILVIFIGGINYANSLILAIAFLLVSIFMVGILHTYSNLSGLCISAGSAENAFVGEQARFEIRLSRDAQSQRAYSAISLSWEEAEATADLLEEDGVSVWLPLWADVRGILIPPRIRVETRYPLGLLKAWTLIQLDHQCLIYPEPIDNPLPAEAAIEAEEGELTRPGNSDFDGLRPYVAGDSPRRMAWKQFARTGEMATKSFVDYASERQVLDFRRLEGFDTEQRLSVLCFWVIKFSESGTPFSLQLPDQVVDESIGSRHRIQCLQALALYGLAKDERDG